MVIVNRHEKALLSIMANQEKRNQCGEWKAEIVVIWRGMKRESYANARHSAREAVCVGETQSAAGASCGALLQNPAVITPRAAAQLEAYIKKIGGAVACGKSKAWP